MTAMTVPRVGHLRAALRRLPLFGLLALLLGAVLSGPATAQSTDGAASTDALNAVITVTTTNQEVDSDGDCSLQEAIFAANFDSNKAIDPSNLNGPKITTGCTAGSGADTIVLAPNAVYQVSGIVQNQFSVAGLSANPDITSTLTIQGNGARLERVGGQNLRAFVVNQQIGVEVSHAQGNLTIQNLHIKGFIAKGGNGNDGGGGGLGAGAAIFNRGGSVTIDNCTFEGNTATGGNGATNQADAGGGGGGGGLGGNGGNSVADAARQGGGGGGGARGNGGSGGSGSGAGGGGTANDGVIGGAGVGGNGGFNCGGKGGDNPNGAASNGFCTGGGGGGGAAGPAIFLNLNAPSADSVVTPDGLLSTSGALGNYGGGGGGGGAPNTTANGGNGGFGGGGGAGGIANGNGGNGGFGGGGGNAGSAGTRGLGGPFGADALGASGGGGGAGLGGAIFNTFGFVTIRNSTFFGNAANGGTGAGGAGNGIGFGGAIFSHQGNTTILHSTISNNTASGSGNSGANAGGIYVTSIAAGIANFTLRNTIVANNSALTGECVVFTEAGSTTNSAGSGNLIETNSGCPGVAQTADPALGPLQINAPGNTPTMAITPASPAFNAGDNAFGLPTDQRGVLRPQGVAVDIGAFEVLVTDLSLTKVCHARAIDGRIDEDVIYAGQQWICDITINNPTGTPVVDFSVTDTVPLGATFVAHTAQADANISGAAAVCAPIPRVGPGAVTCTGLDVAAFTSVTFQMAFTSDPNFVSLAPTGELPITNTACLVDVGGLVGGVFDPSLANNCGSDTDIVKDLADLRLLRPTSVAEVLACSRSHVYRLAKAGELPPPVRISHGVSGWRAVDVIALIDRRIATAEAA